MTAKCLFGLAAALSMFPTIAAAQDSAPAADPAAALADRAGGDAITVGLGAGYMPDYEGSNDYQFTPVPGVIGTVSAL